MRDTRVGQSWVMCQPADPIHAYASTVPSTVANLFAAVGLERTGCVPWGTTLPATSTGEYIVALSSAADAIEGTYPVAPVDRAALDELCTVCPSLTLDGIRRPSREQLAERIGFYWLPDEPC